MNLYCIQTIMLKHILYTIDFRYRPNETLSGVELIEVHVIEINIHIDIAWDFQVMFFINYCT